MGFPRSLKRSAKHKRAKGLAAAVAAVCLIAVLTGPASGHQAAPHSAAVRAQARAHTTGSGSSDVSNVPTLTNQDTADTANLSAIPARMSCADLAQTTEVAGQTIEITAEQTTSATPTSPEYCAVTGHINADIGFEILLPTSTWRQRYLQVGCGGLCGSIRIIRPRRPGTSPWRTATSCSPPRMTGTVAWALAGTTIHCSGLSSRTCRITTLRWCRRGWRRSSTACSLGTRTSTAAHRAAMRRSVRSSGIRGTSTESWPVPRHRS